MANVDLGPDLDRFVQEQIESGRFRNASEVIRAGLLLLQGDETACAQRLDVLRREINAAFDDPAPGRPAEEVFNDLESRYLRDVKGKARAHGA